MSDSFHARLAEVRELRAHDPKTFANRWAARSHRPVLGKRDRLMIVAADHPARGAFGVRGDRLAMIDRNDLLERLVLALERPDVDGVLGTADILDDLLMLGVLDDKLVFGSMNRGGLQGAVFELDDRFTGYDAPTVIKRGLDGGKMLCRIALYDAGTAATLEASGRAITALDDAGLMAMIEPFMSTIRDGRVHNELTTEATMRSMAIASGLGASSAHTWLKVPVVDDMERVMTATTLPTLLLGGDPSGAPDKTYAKWERALGVEGVRGLVVGRALLYPKDGDVAAAVDVAARLVHGPRYEQEGIA